jgi:Cu-processing system ATP-binding protein
MIQIDKLTKTFGRFKALDNISLQLEKGQAVSLLGPNGSGKTTLIKSILGLTIPEKGTIRINGRLVGEDVRYRAGIGYMPQIGRYPENMSIEQVFRMIKDVRKEQTEYDEALFFGFGLNKVKDKKMRTLSGGTRQKVSACLAFLFKPDIYILDEPTAGLDPVSSELLKEKIITECAAGKLVIITSHVLSDLDGLTSHIVYLQDGRLMFHESVEYLKQATGEEKLNKVIASIMQAPKLIPC